MRECRYRGWCRIEYDTDFDVCYPCVGDWGETCAEYEPMPDVEGLVALAKVLDGMGDRYNEHERYELGTTFKAIASQIRKALGVEP